MLCDQCLEEACIRQDTRPSSCKPIFRKISQSVVLERTKSGGYRLPYRLERAIPLLLGDSAWKRAEKLRLLRNLRKLEKIQQCHHPKENHIC